MGHFKAVLVVLSGGPVSRRLCIPRPHACVIVAGSNRRDEQQSIFGTKCAQQGPIGHYRAVREPFGRKIRVKAVERGGQNSLFVPLAEVKA